MKKIALLMCVASVITLVGCKRTSSQDVVKETYIHKYGVPVPKEDWSRNGKDGQVVQLMSDGITVTRAFEKGVLQGKVTYTFPNSSTISVVENYEDGNLVSKIENFQSGIPLREVKYQGQQMTHFTRWYEDGIPAAVEQYQNGVLVQGEYRNALNVLDSQVIDGKGVRIMRSNDGDLLSKDMIENGQMIERVSYFANGDPASITPYENTLIHGMRLTFLQGGLPNTVEEWVHGRQEGTTIVYSNGEKVAEIPYLNGMKNGVESRYRDGKTLVEEISWRNDVQHGPRKIIVDDSSKVEWYHQGELVNRPTFERLNPPGLERPNSAAR